MVQAKAHQAEELGVLGVVRASLRCLLSCAYEPSDHVFLHESRVLATIGSVARRAPPPRPHSDFTYRISRPY